MATSTLTEEQKSAVFEILEVPMYLEIDELKPEYNMTTIRTSVETNTNAAVNRIEQHLDKLADLPDRETVLKGLLDRYILLETKTTRLVNGSVGTINGLDYDPQDVRLIISKKIRHIVPFMRAHEDMEIQDKGVQFVPVCVF